MQKNDLHDEGVLLDEIREVLGTEFVNRCGGLIRTLYRLRDDCTLSSDERRRCLIWAATQLRQRLLAPRADKLRNDDRYFLVLFRARRDAFERHRILEATKI